MMYRVCLFQNLGFQSKPIRYSSKKKKTLVFFCFLVIAFNIFLHCPFRRRNLELKGISELLGSNVLILVEGENYMRGQTVHVPRAQHTALSWNTLDAP